MDQFYIYDATATKIGILENYDSVLWQEDYNGPGYLEIHAVANEDNLALLKIGYSIKNGDSIADIQAVQLADGSIAAFGKMAGDRLSKRVVLKTEQIGVVETSLRTIFTNNVRAAGLTLGAAAGLTEEVDSQVTGGSVLEAIKAVCGASGLGWRVDSDFSLRFYKGVDRRKTEPGYAGVLSDDADTLKGITLTGDVAKYYNVAVVAGAGEGAERVWVTSWIGDTEPTGTARRELFVDARDLTKTYTVEGDPTEYTYTDEQYALILQERGRQKLAERLFDSKFNADAIDGNITYGEDYGLGDIMPVKIVAYGVQYGARVTSATRVYEKDYKAVVKLEKI